MSAEITVTIKADNGTDLRIALASLLGGSTAFIPAASIKEDSGSASLPVPTAEAIHTAAVAPEPVKRGRKPKAEGETEKVKKEDLPPAETTAPEFYVYDAAGDVINVYKTEGEYITGVREVLGQQSSTADLAETWRVNAAVRDVSDKARLELLEHFLADTTAALSAAEGKSSEDDLLGAAAPAAEELAPATNDNVRHALVCWIKLVRGTSNHDKPAELLRKLGAADKNDKDTAGNPKAKASLLDTKHYPAFEKAAAEALGKTVAELRATTE